MKSALFVDFDNVYSGLRKLDPVYADRFARQPLRWVQWLVDELPPPDHAREGARRRLLVRRVYLNPQVYQRYRPAFNHAGFEIIDCPAMTSEGKTSTDIHMVLDMVDLLQHEVHYDEFMVFSADADFTPVLRRLRRWDRRTTVLAVGFPSAAYRASADLLIDPDLFVREALGGHDLDEMHRGAEAGGPGVPAGHPGRDDAIRLELARSGMLRSTAPLAALPLAPLAPLAAVAPAAQPLPSRPAPEEAAEALDSAFTPHEAALPLSMPMSMPYAASAAEAGPLGLAGREVNNGQALPTVAGLEARIRGEVARSELAVPCARLASRLMTEYPRLAPDWLGQGGFRRFMESLELQPYRLDWSGSGGYLYDPQRHVVPTQAATRLAVDTQTWGLDAATLTLIRQVHETTGVPLLSPRDFKALFDAVVEDVRVHPFQLNETGKRVRDHLRDEGRDVSRESVNWVLRGLLLCGHEFGQGQDDVPTLSYRLVGNLISLCRREQMLMDEGAPGVLQRWVSGKLSERPAE